MRNITFDNITDTVVNAYAGTEDPRKREIITLLIQRLHDFVREVKLTPQGVGGSDGLPAAGGRGEQ